MAWTPRLHALLLPRVVLLALTTACAPSGGVGGLAALGSNAEPSAADAGANAAITQSAQPGQAPAEVAPESGGYTLLAQTMSGTLILHEASSLCLDVKGDIHNPNTPLEVWSCNSGANQQFALSANQLVVFGNRCVAPATPGPGAPLVVSLCDPNDTTQQWGMASDSRVHWLTDPRLCLSFLASDFALGSSVGLSACTASGSGQIFDFGVASAALPAIATMVLPFTHEPATANGVTWVNVKGGTQLWPSSGSLDWSPYVRQGASPDCTFVSGLGAMAEHHHEQLRPLLKQTGAHTYQAGFYTGGPSNTASPVQLVWVEVDDKLAVNPDGQTWYAMNPVPDAGNGNAVLFGPLLEKAYALWLEHYRLDGAPVQGSPQGYNGTLGDCPGVAMALGHVRTLDTDHDGVGFHASNVWNYLTMAPAGYPVTTFKNNETPDGLPGGHDYYVLDAWTDAAGNKWVKARNPWGFDHPAISTNLVGEATGTFTMPFTDFMNEFNEVCVLNVSLP